MTKIFKNVWFKCITVLLIIAVISGSLLSILNNVLHVSSEERTNRSIAKLYEEEIELKEDDILLDVDSTDANKNQAVEYDFGSIEKIYKITATSSSDLLFKTTGKNGYKNGTVTLWVKLSEVDGTYAISTVILESNDKQSLMSKFSDDYFSKFCLTDITAIYDKPFAISGEGTLNPNSGASYTATACCNAVNCVIKYMGEGYEK